MEKYNICFGNGWSIENRANIDKDIKLDKVDLELPFGQSEFYKDTINWIYEPFKVQDEWILLCKEIKAFNEKAYFTVMQLDEKWAKVDEFEDTFIDALEYIQKAFNG